MKHIKVYEDLMKDLQSIGVNEHRCNMVIYKELGRSKPVKLLYATIFFPTLTTEKAIRPVEVLLALRDEEIEIKLGEEYLNYVKNNFNRGKMSQFIERREHLLKKKIKDSMDLNQGYFNVKSSKVSYENIIENLLYEFVGNTVHGELIIDRKIVASATED